MENNILHCQLVDVLVDVQGGEVEVYLFGQRILLI